MMVTKYDKAIAALVGTACSFLATKWAGAADPALQAAIITVVTTALVYFVPNAKA
jgi:hypothetical protein